MYIASDALHAPALKATPSVWVARNTSLLCRRLRRISVASCRSPQLNRNHWRNSRPPHHVAAKNIVPAVAAALHAQALPVQVARVMVVALAHRAVHNDLMVAGTAADQPAVHMMASRAMSGAIRLRPRHGRSHRKTGRRNSAGHVMMANHTHRPTRGMTNRVVMVGATLAAEPIVAQIVVQSVGMAVTMIVARSNSVHMNNTPRVSCHSNPHRDPVS